MLDERREGSHWSAFCPRLRPFGIDNCHLLLVRRLQAKRHDAIIRGVPPSSMRFYACQQLRRRSEG
jgi:hypothetical protein